LEFNRVYRLLAEPVYVTLLDKKTNTINKKRKLYYLDTGLEAGAKKSKNMYAHSLSPTRICTFMFCHKNASKNYKQ